MRPLHLAVAHNETGIVHSLLTAGADPFAVTQRGNLPVSLPSDNSRSEKLKNFHVEPEICRRVSSLPMVVTWEFCSYLQPIPFNWVTANQFTSMRGISCLITHPFFEWVIRSAKLMWTCLYQAKLCEWWSFGNHLFNKLRRKLSSGVGRTYSAVHL